MKARENWENLTWVGLAKNYLKAMIIIFTKVNLKHFKKKNHLGK